MFRGRVRATTYLYDDSNQPERITGHLESPAFTLEDRALLLGLTMYESSLCPGPCGQPISEAWHSDMDGWWETDDIVCLACTAVEDGEREVSYTRLRNTRPAEKPLAPFELGETTRTPVA